jgi:hypothetical protein
MQVINFEQNCAPHWGRAQGKQACGLQKVGHEKVHNSKITRCKPYLIAMFSW